MSRVLGVLEFGPPDLAALPVSADLRIDALERGGAWPIVLNAANEVAVEAFLAGRLGFSQFARVIETRARGGGH